MALLLIVLGALGALYVFSFLDVIRRMRTFNYYGSRMPGPPLHPIMGNADKFRGLKSDELTVMFKEEARKARERGETIVRFMLPGKMIVWPLNGAAVAKILESTTEIHKGTDYSFFEPWIGDGLLVAVGEKWKAHRKMITPAFHFAKLDGYFEVFNGESQTLLEHLSPFADSGDTVDVFPYIKRCLLDIICQTAMGTKVDAQSNHDHPYLKATEGYTALMLKYSMNPLLWNRFVFWALGYRRQQTDYLRTLKKFTNDVIAERRAALDSGDVETETSRRRMNFLDLLLSDGGHRLSSEEIREEVETFMFGGHDTTTTSAAWTCWHLAHHPEIQERVYRELVEVCGERGDVTVEQISRLSYVDRVLRESKRLVAPVPAVQRCLQNDLEIDGHTIPAGANVVIAPVALHSNHLVFPDPDVFDPDRFLPEAIARRHPYDFVPFSAGIKNCIGQKFSVLNEKVLIAHMVRAFRLEPRLPYTATRPCFEVVAKPSNGIPVRLVRRV